MRNISRKLFIVPVMVATISAAQVPQPRHGALPSLAPGEMKTLSTKDLDPEAKAYFEQQAPQSDDMQRNADGVSYRKEAALPQAVHMLDRFVTRSKPVLEKAKLSAQPVDLPESFTGRAKVLGYIGEVGTSGKTTRLSRIFNLDDKTIMLTEWDYLTDGGGILQFSEFITTTVNGAPAVLVVQASDAGALWTMSWATASRHYLLYVQEPQFAESTASFVQRFATSIPDKS